MCHIVQLAVAKKLLRHFDGYMVPYDMAEEPREVEGAGGCPVATWQQVVAGVNYFLLSSDNPTPGSMSPSHLKRMFKDKLGLQLCEEALGHSKLSEVLQDVRLRHVCSVGTDAKARPVIRAYAGGQWPAHGLAPAAVRPPPGLEHLAPGASPNGALAAAALWAYVQQLLAIGAAGQYAALCGGASLFATASPVCGCSGGAAGGGAAADDTVAPRRARDCADDVSSPGSWKRRGARGGA
uniref:HTH OST-type domain-containing protein n=1 Tax=Zooxanthella nutricula TaxID=1333877 RepID=A0A7S2H4C3_9DINO|mmetsp:Transcript_100231/g.306362  ORF Transcript_100231/g.306362 Transcript_100231/m.306362 type:complete len:238 (+) Transcript_100231:1-714(+)